MPHTCVLQSIHLDKDSCGESPHCEAFILEEMQATLLALPHQVRTVGNLGTSADRQ